MFVYVEYEANLKTAVVEHTQVRHVDSRKGSLEPLNVDDFDAAETYRVHTCNGGDNSDCEYLNAKIIHMTETLEEMVAFRSKRPKRSVTKEEVGSQRSKQKGPRASCTAAQQLERGHAERVQRQLLIERALHDYEAEVASENTLKALENRLRAVEQQQSQGERGSRRKSSESAAESDHSVPRSEYAVLETKYLALQQNIEELQTLNSELERRLKSEKSHNGSTFKTEGSAERDLQAQASTSKPDGSADQDLQAQECKPERLDLPCSGREFGGEPEVGTVGKDGKLYGGCGFWFSEAEWSKLFSAKSDFTFCTRAANLFWTESELAECSVTGKLSNASIARGNAVQRPPLSPDKLSALKDLFRVYIGKDPLASRRLKMVCAHLSAHLHSIRLRRKSAAQRLSAH